MIVVHFVATTFLDLLNLNSIKKHRGDVPEMYKSFMDSAAYNKALSYTADKIKFSIFESACTAVFLALVVALWVLPKLFDVGMDTFGVSLWGQAITLIFIAVLLSLPELPFELYSQFVIEQEYGFNKSTIKLWFIDKIKGLIVGLILGAPIITLILWFSQTFKSTWWIWGFVAVALFQVLMIIIYPRFIVPIFNKLEDLPEGELREKLFAIAEKGDFKASKIQVIDGSKRSSHSNAYFTGLGRFRRIVLFDTLISQLTNNELEAVLAHEIGHYKKGHIVKMICMSFAMTFLMFGVIGYLSQSAWFYEGFGFCEASGFGPVLLMFSMFSGLFTFWLNPILNALSRKHEYEADKFASNLCESPDYLCSALKKLHKENLGNPVPHPVYSAFYYSHPTLAERIDALQKHL